MDILVKKLIVGDKLVDYDVEDENNTPLNLAMTYLKICMEEDGCSFSEEGLKDWVEDFIEYLNEINDEELSNEDCLDEVCNNVMWTNSPFAFDEEDKQIPNHYIRLAEKELYNKLENVIK